MSPSHSLPLTHSATLRRLLYEGLDALGLDPAQIYRQAYQGGGLAAGVVHERLVHEMAPLFWQALPRLSGDHDIGLHLGEVMRPRPMDAVGYAQLASSNLREALQVFVRFQHILSGGFAARLEEGDELACLVIDLDYRDVACPPQYRNGLTQLARNLKREAEMAAALRA